MVGESGRVRLRFCISVDNEGRRKLLDLNSLPMDKDLDSAIDELGIWSLDFSHNEKENLIPTNGYSGYVALDQVNRGNALPSVLHSDAGSMHIVESLRQIYAGKRALVRDDWRNIHESRRNPIELVQWMIEGIERLRGVGRSHGLSQTIGGFRPGHWSE